MVKTIIHAEWIGKHAKVSASRNPSLVGLEGIIIDETQNTVSIETTRGVKHVPKKDTTFEIEGQPVQGNEVLVSPEERIKR